MIVGLIKRNLERHNSNAKDALVVREFRLELGEALYVATYEHVRPGKEFRDEDFHVTSAEEACDYVLGRGVFSIFDFPVTSACAFESDAGFDLACKDAIE